MEKEKIKAMSLRIMGDNGAVLGSGFLFLPVGDYAYIFTAAHVIEDAETENLHIEFYHTDEVDDQEAYQLYIDKNEFKIELSYRAVRNNAFSPYDIAGVQIRKREWMDQIECFYLAEPLDDLYLYCVGYPRLTGDPMIDFAAHEASAYVKYFNRNRIQFAIQGTYDMTEIVNHLAGMSGTGLAINATGNCECLTGIWTCSQGTAAVGGTMNGITQNAIRNLCQQNNWPLPLTKIVKYQMINGERIPMVDDDGETYDDLEIRQTDYELADVHDDFTIRLEEIRTDLLELQVESVLQKSDSLLETLTDVNEYRYEVSRIHIYKANAYMLLHDSEGVKRELEDAENYSEQEKGLAFIMLANDSFAAQDIISARQYINNAIECGGEHTQALLFKQFLSVMEAEDTTYEQDTRGLETVAHAQPMTEREWKQYFQLCANICILKYGKIDLAIRFTEQSFSITADKTLLLCIAQDYQNLTYLNPNRPDIVMADNAVRYYNNYLKYADELLQNQFYRLQGTGYIELLYFIQDYTGINSRIDKVMEYADEATVSRLKFIKAHSLIACGDFNAEIMDELDKTEKSSLLLHQRFVQTSNAYAQYLDAKCGYEYDKSINNFYDDTIEANLRDDGVAFAAEFDRIIYLILRFLRVGQNNTMPITVQLKLDVLNMCLYLKKGDIFCALLDDCLLQYPEMDSFTELGKFRSEANNNLENTEVTIVTLLNNSFTYQNVKESVSYYLRNTKPEEILALYRRALSDRTVGEFHRDQLILGYLSFLSLPKTNDAELVQEYLQYKNGLAEEQRLQFKDMIRNTRGLEMPD